MDEFPGRVPGGTVWVEHDQDARNDGVSSVVVGSADWAGAWAIDDISGQPLFSLSPGGERQREWAYRFGVNLVMYALTGNYKSDLVHAPFIQQRLGNERGDESGVRAAAALVRTGTADRAGRPGAGRGLCRQRARTVVAAGAARRHRAGAV